MVDLDEYYDDVTKIDLEFDSKEQEMEFLATIDAAAKGKYVSRGEFIRFALRQQLDILEEEERAKQLEESLPINEKKEVDETK